jgi:hypothetical protein
MTKTQELDGQTFTEVDEETYRDERGGEWVRWERPEMLRKVRWAEAEMRRQAANLQDPDAASAYCQALEIKAETEEDLRIIEELWDL